MTIAEKYPIHNHEFPASIPPLYHYTSATGLLGMLDYKKLWFTQLNFSNDVVESSYGVGLIKQVMEEYLGLVYTNTYTPDLNTEKDFSQLDLPLVFTFSLSEDKDSLSQWRGYCPNGGYSIRFDSEQLDAMLKRENLTIGKCIYEKDDQVAFIREQIIRYPTVQAYEADRSAYGLTKWGISLNQEINERARRYAPLIKHPKFKEEQEWKIFASYFPPHVSGPTMQRFFMKTQPQLSELRTRIKFRPGKSTVIPYLEMLVVEDKFAEDKVTKVKQFVHLPEVIVGPTPNIELARAACQMLLDKHEPIKNPIHIDTSGVARCTEIPYKHW
jgi:hypothetical protein